MFRLGAEWSLTIIVLIAAAWIMLTPGFQGSQLASSMGTMLTVIVGFWFGRHSTGTH